MIGSKSLFPELPADLDRLRREAEEVKEAKRRLEHEQMFRLEEEERHAVYRQYLVRSDIPRIQQNNRLTKLQAQRERIQEELLIHAKLDIMQLVRGQFRAPKETDKEVS